MATLIGAIGVNLLAWVALACAARWQTGRQQIPIRQPVLKPRTPSGDGHP